ncbi:uncharacterized protein VTP21DRAFT_10998 [Calcarisporiella thermophila]|uniref:uncharacterized protein n=1 Tax=Calcarisporiella thermophila TaxID=911321 RepID=UPI003743E3CF
MTTSDYKFQCALTIIQELSPNGPLQPTNDEKLQLYGLYKQAMLGDCQGTRPSMWDLVGRAKWDAWNRFRGIGQDAAKTRYVETLVGFLRRYPNIPLAEELIDALEKGEQNPPHEYGSYESELDSGEEAADEDHGDDVGEVAATSPRVEATPSNTSSTYPRYSPTLTKRSLRGSPRPPRPAADPAEGSSQRFEESPLPSPHTPAQTPTYSRRKVARTRPLAGKQPQGSTNVTSAVERALELLQMEVTALNERINMLRRELEESESKKRRMGGVWGFLRAAIWQAIVNIVILAVISTIIYRRRTSSWPYAVLSYLNPLKQLRDVQ